MKKSFILIISIATTALLACNPVQNLNISGIDSSEISDSEETKKEFTFTSAEEVENISDEDLIYILNHDYITYDFFPEGEYAELDLFGVEMQGPTEDCPQAAAESVKLKILYDNSLENVNDLQDSQQIKTFAVVDIADAIHSCVTMFPGDRTGISVKDDEVIFCGENDSYVEYSGRFTEIRSYYDNRDLVTNEIPRAYRWIYMKSLVYSETDESTQLVMLGELSSDYVKEQLDIYCNMQNGITLYREVTEEEDSYMYIRYYAMNISGDYEIDDRAELYKEVVIVDKETQVVHYETTEQIKAVDIPGTAMEYPREDEY